MMLPAPTKHSEAGARVLPIPPPLYFGAALAGGMALSSTGPAANIGSGVAKSAVGGVVLVAGVALAVAGIAQVRRARTTIVPHRPVTTLLTSGAYRISRNPMYTGLALAYLGCTLIIGSWWPMLTWPLALLAVRVLVIGPEERYLDTRFGHAYHEYRSHTRRWIGRYGLSAGNHSPATRIVVPQRSSRD